MRRIHVISLLVVVLVGVGSLAGVLLASWSPVLGVQLQGGVEVVLRPTTEVADDQLDQAIEIIRSRVDALGVAEPDITRQGTQVVIQLPGVKDKQRAVDLVGQTAELRFRPVINSFVLADEEAFAQEVENTRRLNEALDDFLAQQEAGEGGSDSSDGSGGALDTEEPAAEGPAVEEPSNIETTEEPAADGSAADAPSVEEPAADESSVDAPSVEEPAADEPSVDEPAVEEPSKDEVAVIGTDTDGTTETDTTEETEALPPGELTSSEQDLADRAVVLAGTAGVFGYSLAPAEMTGEAVADAVATFNNEWVVNLNLTSEGAVQFDALAQAYYQRQVSIVLDGIVESAPVINATEFGGVAVITGGFTAEEAQDLALVLRFGALPVEFVQDDVRTVSATLGEGTLRAGIIAGLVGLVLVGAYMLLYYRLLGLVAIGSLSISGAILWSLISWLGESSGLALTLAGITGIIVSIGVQVDSNIVYYERIKEEVRRGRAARSAADASFPAAFATIVWADMASLIGAGVLYQLTSGTVRGFALYLGIATLIDLAVSYFFMRPLVVLIVRKMVGDHTRRLGMPAPEQPLSEQGLSEQGAKA